jgi:hypothetical protein
MHREMRQMWSRVPKQGGYLLSELLQQARRLQSVSEGLVWATVSIGDPFPNRVLIHDDGFENVVAGDEDQFDVKGIATI